VEVDVAPDVNSVVVLLLLVVVGVGVRVSKLVTLASRQYGFEGGNGYAGGSLAQTKQANMFAKS